MITSRINKKRLAQAVLASTLFVAPMAFATVIDSIVGSQTTSGNGGIIEVDFDGQIVSDGMHNGNAVTVDSSGLGIVITNPFNSTAGQNSTPGTPGTFIGPQDGRYAIFATTSGNNGISVEGPGNADIRIGAGSGVTSLDGYGIVIDSGTETIIRNLGTIQAPLTGDNDPGYAIEAFDSGDVIIDNRFSGVIQNDSDTTIYIDDVNLILSNTGVIQHTNVSDDYTIEIYSEPPFITELVNKNFGRILHQGTTNTDTNDTDTIYIDEISGNIINEYGGLISQDNVVGNGETIEIDGANPDMLIKNAGTIQNLGSDSAIYIDSASIVGLIVNEHTGVISSFDTTIYAESGVTIGFPESPYGLINHGVITTLAEGEPAIDFSANGIFAGIDQRGGTITGDVFLAESDSLGGEYTFRMSGGKIAGDVIANVPNAVNPNIIELSGGRLLGTLFLGPLGDTVNLGWDAKVVDIVGGIRNDIYNVYGGEFINLFNNAFDATDNDVLNILGDVTFNGGSINGISTINVGDDPVVFVLNGNINNLGTDQSLPFLGGLFISEDSLMIFGAGSNITSSGTNAVVMNYGSLWVPRGTPKIDLTSSQVTDFEGIVANYGRLSIDHDAVLQIVTDGNPDYAPSFHGIEYSVLQIGVAGIENEDSTPSAGQLWVSPTTVDAAPTAGNIVLDSRSFIQPVVEGFIPYGQRYNIVYDLSGQAIFDDSTIIQPNSAVISFWKHLRGPDGSENVLQLVTHRNSYESLADKSTEGVARVLDDMAAAFPSVDPEFLPHNPWGHHHHHDHHHQYVSQTFLDLLTRLDRLPTREDIVEALDSLQFFNNGGLSRVTFNAMNNVFDSTVSRIEDLMMPGHRMAPRGMNYGDTFDRGGVWVEALGTSVNQDNRDAGSDRHHDHDRDDHHHRGEVPGYRASGVGVALGADWAVSDCVLLGLAGSYMRSDLHGKDRHHDHHHDGGDGHRDLRGRKDADIDSWQATAYGWFQVHPRIYIDAAIGLATNHFDTKRHIPIVDGIEHHEHEDDHHHGDHVIAKGLFDGTTWGAQADLGWLAIDSENYFFVPFARLRWAHIDMDDVREKGAGDFGLRVRNDDSNEFLGGIGFRLGGKYGTGNVQYVPELSAMVAYDFDHDDRHRVRSSFIGDPEGVFGFISEGPESNRTSFDLGLGVNAHIAKNSIFSIKYNLELRDKFVGNSGFVKYYYVWG